MILRAEQIFDKVYLDREHPSDFIDYISYAMERELFNKFIDQLKDHKLRVVELKEPEFIGDLPGSWSTQGAYRQDLVCLTLVQCENCKYNPDKPHKYYDDDLTYSYAWCWAFIQDLNGEGYCPYGKEIEDEQ